MATAGLVSLDTAVFGGYPLITTLGVLAKSHFEQAIRLQTQKTLEAFRFIYNNRDVFTKQVIQSDDFQEGFLSWFNQYLILRGKEKRLGALVLFRTFAETEDESSFPLERFMDTLHKISSPALRALAFIKYEVILPDIQRNAHNIHGRLEIKDYSSQELSRTPLSKLTEHKMNEKVLMSAEEYSNYEQMKSPKKEQYMRAWEEKARNTRKSFYNTLDELTYLGLIVKEIKPSDDRFVVNSDESEGWWRISDFAAEFIDYIELAGTEEDRFTGVFDD